MSLPRQFLDELRALGLSAADCHWMLEQSRRYRRARLLALLPEGVTLADGGRGGGFDIVNTVEEACALLQTLALELPAEAIVGLRDQLSVLNLPTLAEFKRFQELAAADQRDRVRWNTEAVWPGARTRLLYTQ